MSRIYRIPISGSAQTVQVDFFEVVAGAAKIVELVELHLSQLTEVKDAEEEMLLVHIKTGATTTGSGGAAPTAIPRNLGDVAFSGTVETMNTTKATAGTIVTHESFHWNVRVPFQRIWLPDTEITLQVSTRATVELATTPGDSITFGGLLVIRERG